MEVTNVLQQLSDRRLAERKEQWRKHLRKEREKRDLCRSFGIERTRLPSKRNRRHCELINLFFNAAREQHHLSEVDLFLGAYPKGKRGKACAYAALSAFLHDVRTCPEEVYDHLASQLDESYATGLRDFRQRIKSGCALE